MLNSLHVKNLALIEETEVEFGKGLNILTGETGAGKSIIIGSINLALGAKAEKEMIRTGKEYALVELVFSLNEEQKKRCLEMELEPEDDMLVISRKISTGKSLCRVNGETVTAKQLKELAGVLIDVYGQYEHQSLTLKKKQFEILDAYCKEALAGIKEKIAADYKQYRELLTEWEQSGSDDKAREKECDLLAFEIQEIEEARLVPGEDEELEAAFRRMANARKIMEGVEAARGLLENDTCENISDLTGRAVRELKAVETYDENLVEISQQLSQIESLVMDVSRELSDYSEEMEFSPEAFEETRSRLDLLNHLKAKYGNTIEEILSYQEEQTKQLEKLRHYDEYLAELSKKLQNIKKKLLTECKKASKIRKEQALILQEQMCQALRELNFLEVDFRITVESAEEKLSASGIDEIGFEISLNPGEPVKPLGMVASGGELSRIMLGLKTVMAQKDAIDTLIFDEIDAGISGKTAWQVSKKLAVLGREHQVICITHLPQIAAMSDRHFKIEKMQEENHTRTEISRLDEESSICELARLLGSDALTEAAISNAKEMKELAADTKQY